ncbi:MAG: DUF2007 domain-containing protein [Planctomycetota bacterium]
MKKEHPDYKPVKVYSSSNSTDILIVKMALEREEIPFELTNENLASWIPGLDGISQIDVLTNERDEARALKVIAAQFKKRGEKGEKDDLSEP